MAWRNKAMSTDTHREALVSTLRRTRLVPVTSRAVRKLGYAPKYRMAAVQYNTSDTVYGYPGLDDNEIAGLVKAMQPGASVGEYVTKVIKAHHDHEHVRSDEAAR